MEESKGRNLLKNPPSQDLTRSTQIKKSDNDLLRGPQGDEEPIEYSTPKISPTSASRPKVPGYVSKFSHKINEEEKALIVTAEDMYQSRVNWNVDSSDSSSLYYTSKTPKMIQDEKDAVEATQKLKEESLQNSLLVPFVILLFTSAYLLSLFRPETENKIIAAVLVLISLVVLFISRSRTSSKESEKKPFKSYKIKLVTHMVGLPDDIANALQDDEKRKRWDSYITILKEKKSKLILYRKNQTCCQILEQRVSEANTMRETFIDLSKIKGKPYFLRLSVFTTVTEEMSTKAGSEVIRNNINSLRNFVVTEDSISELSVSLSNIKGEGNSFIGSPQITITDLLGEIEEVDMGEDAITEQDDESTIFHQIDEEEVKVGISKSSPPKRESSAPAEDDEEEKESPKKELTFDEQFEKDLEKCSEREKEFIRKAKDGVKKLTDLIDSPDWKHIGSKGNEAYSMDVAGGLKAMKGEGYISYTAEQIKEYLSRDNVQTQFDDQFAEGGTVEILPMDTKFIFNRFKGVMFVSGRDFCMLAITLHKPNGQIIISSFSHEHDDCPPHKKYVRGEVITGGWILTPDENDKNRTFAQYVAQTDLKGSIPKKIVNSVSEKQALTVSKVNEAMKKNL